MKYGYFVAPNGKRIVGTLETVLARGNFEEFGGIGMNDNGSIELFHDGSEIFYDSMMSVQRNGQLVYLDEDGDEWPTGVLTFIESDKRP